MDNNMMMNIIFIGGMFLIMYFFMIRPKTLKDKEQRKFLDELSKGDSVITLGGVHGKVSSITEDVIVLEVDRGTKITVEKSSVSAELSKKKSK